MKPVVLALIVCGAVSLDAAVAATDALPAAADAAAPNATAPKAVMPKPTKALRTQQAKAALAAKAVGDKAGSPASYGPPVPLPQLSVEEIVTRNVAARGGADAWQRVRALQLEGRLDAGRQRVDGGNIGATRGDAKIAKRREVALLAHPAPEPKVIQLPFRLELQRPHQMRLEIPFRNATAIQVFDGHDGWKVRPFLGRGEAEPYTADELRAASGEQELDGPLIGHAAKGIRVALDGTEMVDDRKAYRLKLTLADGQERRLWVDAENFLDLKMEGPPRRFDGRLRPVVTRFKDYRTVQGVQVAHLLETSVQGTRQVERVLVDKVQVNPALDARRFAKPA
jgi:hypothetical protein